MDINYFNKIIYMGVSNRLKEKFIKNNFYEFYNFIIDNYEIYPRFIEKLYVFSHYKHKCYCGAETKFIDFKSGYLEYCSIKCSRNSEKTKEKYKNTCIEKYGVDNVSKLESIKNTKANTSMINCGFKTILQTDIVKNIVKEKYGVDNVFKSQLIKERIKNTINEKYGVDHFTKTELYKDMRKETCISKYGVDHFSKTNEWKEIIKLSNLDKYLTNLNLSENYRFISKEGSLNTINHLECGNNFNIKSQLIRLRIIKSQEICTLCNKISYHKENELYGFIKSIFFGEIIKSYRDVFEIDIYLPELKIGFEFNGLYWHSELFKDKNYHISKTNYFKERGIKIIHIWEDNWLYKRQIIESIIKSKLNLYDNKIDARKCTFIEVNDSEVRFFLNENHIQGWCVSKYRYGLKYNDELVSIITLGKNRINLDNKNVNEFELLRYVNRINLRINGGFSKLIKNSIKILDIEKIFTHSDISLFDGSVYIKNGFIPLDETKPDYSYIIKGVRKNRFSFNKHKLLKMGYDIRKTEKEIMFENNYYRIYDCGNLKFELNIEKIKN